MWGREMDGVPVLTREGGKGDEELGGFFERSGTLQWCKAHVSSR